MSQTPERIMPVDVRNFDMSFGRMVIFMVKWAIATIPALLILIAVGFAAVAFLGGFTAALKRQRAEENVPAAAALVESPSRLILCPLPLLSITQSDRRPPSIANVESLRKSSQGLLALRNCWHAVDIKRLMTPPMQSKAPRASRHTR